MVGVLVWLIGLQTMLAVGTTFKTQFVFQYVTIIAVCADFGIRALFACSGATFKASILIQLVALKADIASIFAADFAVGYACNAFILIKPETGVALDTFFTVFQALSTVLYFARFSRVAVSAAKADNYNSAKSQGFKVHFDIINKVTTNS